jgi:hypothetical protein
MQSAVGRPLSSLVGKRSVGARRAPTRTAARRDYQVPGEPWYLWSDRIEWDRIASATQYFKLTNSVQLASTAVGQRQCRAEIADFLLKGKGFIVGLNSYRKKAQHRNLLLAGGILNEHDSLNVVFGPLANYSSRRGK